MVLKVEDPPHQARRKVYRDLNLQIVFGVTLMVVLGVSSIAPAFPKIAKALSLSHNEIELLVSVFTLPGVFLTPVFGFFADRFGRKRILIPALFLFGLAGGLAFFCKSLHLLLLLRFIQGVGAASLGSINLTIIGDLYSGKDRIAAMGYNSSALSIGTASYPAIGGALAVLGWNYPFLLAFLAIPVGLLVMFRLKNPEPKNTQDIAAYFRDVLNIIKRRRVFGLFIAGMVTFIILYGAFITYFPLLMESSFGSSAFIIGIFMSTFAVSNGITAYQLEKLSRRYSELFLIKAGFILYVIVLLIIPFAPNIWILLLPTLLSGVANGINIPSILSLLAESAPINNRAVFMSINGMILRLGQTIGPLFIGLFYDLGGMEFAFVAASVFVLIMTGVVIYLIS
jgi:ACDE family multidrug resistance protein